MDLQRLNILSPDALRVWLRDALHDRVPLPKLTPDEPPAVAILRVEPELERLTRGDLASACMRLVRDFAGTLDGDEDYLRGLLCLAADLHLPSEVTRELVDLSRLPNLDPGRRRLVLQGLNMLRAPQPLGFWNEIFEMDRNAFAAPTLKGMLITSWRAGLSLLPRLPDRAALADATASIVTHALEDLEPADRTPCLRELQELLPRCTPLLREALEEVVLRFSPTHGVAPRPRLTEALSNPRFSKCAPPSGQPRSARLAHAA